MFGILTISRKKPDNWLEYIYMRFFTSRKVKIENRTERMAVFRVAEIILPTNMPVKTAAKRIDRALLKLKEAGVHRVIAPKEAEARLPQLALVKVGRRQTLHACIEQIVLAAAADKNIRLDATCINVFAKRMTKDISRGVLTIAPLVRTVRLNISVPCPAMEDTLLTSYGIACRGELPGDTESINLLLDESEREIEGFTIDLTAAEDEKEDYWIPHIRAGEKAMAQCPDGTAPDDFTAALHLSGGITPGEITVQNKDKMP